MKGKKGQFMTVLLSVAVLVFIVGVIGAAYYVPKLVSQEAVGTVAPLADQPATTVQQSSFCANNPDVDLEIRSKDSLQESATYRAGNVYLVDQINGNVITEKAITGTTSTRSDLTDALKCGHEYEIWTQTDQDSNNYSASSTPLLTLSAADTSQDPLTKDVEVMRNTADIKIRCYDNSLGDWMYIDNGTVVPIASNFHGLEKMTDVNFSSTVNGSNMALGNGEDFDVTCELKTVSVDQQFGLNAILAMDYSDSTDVADWDDSQFSLSWNGVSLTELVSGDTISSNDVTALTGNEKFYKLDGGVTDKKNLLDIQGLTSSSGTIDRDLVFQICGTGTYVSNNDPSVLLHDVCFRDDGSSRTQILTSTSRGWDFLID